MTRYTDIAGKLEAEIFFNFLISLACKKKGQAWGTHKTYYWKIHISLSEQEN